MRVHAPLSSFHALQFSMAAAKHELDQTVEVTVASVTSFPV